MHDDAINRFVLLILLQAKNDHASEVVIDASVDSKAAIKYEVDGTWYEIAQPPSSILPSVSAELRRLAGITQEKREGVIETDYSGDHLRWKVVNDVESRFTLAPA